jgi:hypothetical protein
MNVWVIRSRPRRNGNSRQLPDAVVEGSRDAGHDTELVHLAEHLRHFLRDCRNADGHCTIDDGYERLLRDTVLPAGRDRGRDTDLLVRRGQSRRRATREQTRSSVRFALFRDLLVPTLAGA